LAMAEMRAPVASTSSPGTSTLAANTEVITFGRMLGPKALKQTTS
jgi:hypothetical protein